MILNTPVTTTQTDIHPRLAMLHRKYRDLTIERSEGQHDNMPTAATYIPSSGKGVAFDRLITPIGATLLCELTQQSNPDDRFEGGGGYFQGYRAIFLPHTLETLWEPEPWLNFPISAQTYATAYDERLMRSPRLLDTLIGLGHLAQRLSEDEPMDYWKLTLPPTLVGFDPEEPGLMERLSSQATVAVRTHARTHGLTIEQAWQELDSSTRVEGDIAMTGLRLVDARLCANGKPWPDDMPEVLSGFHDLRSSVGRQVTNPTRKLTNEELAEFIEMLDQHNNHTRVAQQLRRLLPWHIADGCTDADLIAALRNADGPLIASRIAKRQAWCD